jgi:DegV family protein with EDD domain
MVVRVVTDSSCDLPEGIVEALGITVVSLTVRFGDDEYVDRVNITGDEFWKRCASEPLLPQTAAPSPGQFEDAYRRLAEDGATGILVLNISRDLSATMESAEIAARAFGGSVPVTVIDSRQASMGLGLMVVECATRARDGAGLGELAELARSMIARTRVVAALDTLENLKKGGRIGGAKALLATALSIKPIIEIRDGVVAEAGKQRTRSKALALLVDKVREAGEIEAMGVLHAQCADVDEFIASIRSVYSGEITIGEIGAVIGTHAGTGAIGVAFRTRSA